MKRLLAVLAIGALILPVALAAQANSQSEKTELKVWLKVTNTKTGTVHTAEWVLGAYQFENNIPIDVPDFKVAKMKKIFSTDAFTFTFQKKVHQGSWLHFEVELGGTPVIGEVLSIKFV